MKSRFSFFVFGSVWFIAVCCGLAMLVVYQDTPGKATTPATQWPGDSRLELASDRATLVLIAHPKCPCSRASIGELNTLLANCHDKVAVHVLFVKPRGMAKDWERTDLWRSSAAMPGVTVAIDDGGVEARRFHAATSGQTLLFDSAGKLLFSGGITGGRGHAGDNDGRSAIVALLTTGRADRDKTPVFGCALYQTTTVQSGHGNK